MTVNIRFKDGTQYCMENAYSVLLIPREGKKVYHLRKEVDSVKDILAEIPEDEIEEMEISVYKNV